MPDRVRRAEQTDKTLCLSSVVADGGVKPNRGRSLIGQSPRLNIVSWLNDNMKANGFKILIIRSVN